MSFLIFSKKDGFLDDNLEWTTKIDEAKVVSDSDAKAIVSQIVKQGFNLVPKSKCTLVLAEGLTDWVVDVAFSKSLDEIETFCSSTLGISCHRLENDNWVVHQSGGHRTKCETSKMRHFANEALKYMTGAELMDLASKALNQSIYQIGVDIIAIQKG
ncbi:hypothetical protein [Vibrio sp. D431a]|uniref:hypothetical protein n=1 Tax=Vibrio sp. D431a TaxID=2837388 RepID=UPI002556C16A|nr:hypothetical protein [Vibrio sp. D431a]MDK9790115.1 hypothetical protein [Vibrio sp. D431a]